MSTSTGIYSSDFGLASKLRCSLRCGQLPEERCSDSCSWCCRSRGRVRPAAAEALQPLLLKGQGSSGKTSLSLPSSSSLTPLHLSIDVSIPFDLSFARSLSVPSPPPPPPLPLSSSLSISLFESLSQLLSELLPPSLTLCLTPSHLPSSLFTTPSFSMKLCSVSLSFPVSLPPTLSVLISVSSSRPFSPPPPSNSLDWDGEWGSLPTLPTALLPVPSLSLSQFLSHSLPLSLSFPPSL